MSLPYLCLSIGAFGTLGSAAFYWEGKITVSALMVLAPSFISSLSRIASHPATDPVNGVGGLQLEASRRRAHQGPGGPTPDLLGCPLRPRPPPAAAAPRVQPGSSPNSVPQGAGERMGGSSVSAFELRAVGGNEKPSW